MTNTPKTVLLATESSTKPTVYHTQECANAPQYTREVPIGYARERNLTECKICQGVHTTVDQTHRHYQLLEKLDPEDV